MPPLIEVSDEDLEFLRTLSHEIKTQNNAATAHPYFITVRTSRRIIVTADCDRDGIVYVDHKSDDHPTYDSQEEARKALEDPERGLSSADVEEHMEELTQYGTELVYEDHNVFFTRKGFREHMELNGHNYRGYSMRDPHSYTHHAFRNPEIKRLLEIIHKLGGQDGGGDQSGTPDAGRS